MSTLPPLQALHKNQLPIKIYKYQIPDIKGNTKLSLKL